MGRAVKMKITMMMMMMGMSTMTEAVDRPPLILVPGFTGCSLEYKLVNKKTQYFGCPKNTDDYEVLWLDAAQMTPANALCFAENMQSIASGNSLSNFAGVYTRPRDFGGVEGLMYQDLERKIPSFYKAVVDYFTQQGWRVGETMFGAPYDWRYAGIRPDTYFADLKALIEETYREANSKVTLFAHSMGPSVVLYFLRGQTQAWRDQYIAAFLPIVPVWSGNAVSVWNAVSGLDCKSAWGSECPGGEGAMGKLFLRQVGTTIPSMYWTFPLPGAGSNDGTWDKNEPVISTPSKNYSAFDMNAMLKDLGLGDAVKMHSIVEGSHQPFDAPLVDTYVFYGSGVKTPRLFVYPEDFAPPKPGQAPPKQSNILYNHTDDGDGVVSLRSALRSQKWAEAQAAGGKKLEHKPYPGMTHTNTVPVLADIVKLMLARQEEWTVASEIEI